MKRWSRLTTYFFFAAAAICGVFAYLSPTPELLAISLTAVLIFSLFGGYYLIVDKVDAEYEARREPYERAHYHQARRKTLKVVKGGKR